MTVDRRHFLGLLAGAGALTAMSRALAEPPPGAGAPDHDGPLDAALAEVARARASLKSLDGPFTQERSIGLLSAKVRSTGTLTLVAPDRLRWELAPPDDVIYWVTPEGLAYRSRNGSAHVSANGAGSARIAGALDDLRTVIGGDLAKLRGRYDVTLVSGPPSLAFEATPRAKDGAPAQRISFALAEDRVSPRRIEIIEGAHDRTLITFGPLERDRTIDPARMRPTSP